MSFETSATNVRVTKGVARYKLPWYRRLLMNFIGRSHLW
jgi:hypothetical protein